MRLLDEIHLERPFYGSRRLRDELETQGTPVNRKRVQRLVRQMGLRALYPKPRTSQPGGRTHGVSVPAEGPVHRATESGVGNRYLLHPDGARVHVSGGHPGIGTRAASWPGGCRTPSTATSVSRPSRTRSPATGRRDSSIRPRRPVHVQGVYDGAQDPRGGHQHGRQGPLGRQRVRRAALAQRQIRGCVSPCVRNTSLAPRRADRLFQFYNGRRRHSSLGRRTPDVVYFGTTGFGTAA